MQVLPSSPPILSVHLLLPFEKTFRRTSKIDSDHECCPLPDCSVRYQRSRGQPERPWRISASMSTAGRAPCLRFIILRFHCPSSPKQTESAFFQLLRLPSKLIAVYVACTCHHPFQSALSLTKHRGQFSFQFLEAACVPGVRTLHASYSREEHHSWSSTVSLFFSFAFLRATRINSFETAFPFYAIMNATAALL